MNTHQFKDNLIDSLINNDALNNWSENLYHRKPIIIIGADERERPEGHVCPYIELILPGKKTGPVSDYNDYYFGVGLAVYDEDEKAGTHERVYENAGIDRLEAFRKIVQGLIKASLPPNTTISEIETENLPVEEFPFFRSTMIILVREKFRIGTDVYE